MVCIAILIVEIVVAVRFYKNIRTCYILPERHILVYSDASRFRTGKMARA